MEQHMTKTKLFAAAAVISGLVATPVLAKDTMHKHSKRIHAQHSAANVDMRDNADRGDYANRGTGFWPADVAGNAVGGAVGVAGAAVGTAGAIASAPFRGWDSNYDNSYAYDNGGRYGYNTGYNSGYNNTFAFNSGYNNDYNYDGRDSYARRNNFVCQPGTWFRGEDGSRHICQ
jgi:hypothetical protein